MSDRSRVVVDIDALAPNGDGIATSGGRRLTVPFTIPGERVRIDLVERGRFFAELTQVVDGLAYLC